MLATDVLDALFALRRTDAAARLGCVAAAELHLGRPPSVPLGVATRCDASSLPRGLLQPEAPAPGLRGDLRFEGIRLPDLEHTAVALMGGADLASLELLVAMLRQGSSLERRAVDVARLRRAAAGMGDAATRARAAWWCFRLGAGAPSAPSGGAIPLWAGGSARAPREPRFGLILNFADDLPDVDGAAAEVFAAAGASRRHVADIAVLFAMGLALSPSRLPASLRSAVSRLLEFGFVAAEGAQLRPRGPFEGACAAIATATPGTRRRALCATVARGLRDARDAGDVAQAVHTALCLGDVDGALRRAAAIGDRLAEAPPAALVRLLAAVPSRRLRSLARVAPAVFERLGRWDELAEFLAAELRTTRGTKRGRLLVAVATAAWRRDRIAEAEAALEAAAKLPRMAPADRFEAALLRATLDAEAGALEASSQTLREALGAARRAGDAVAEARALHRLGSIEARRGRPRDALAHYDAALLQCPMEARALRGVLLSNSAAMLLWIGRADAAVEVARAAWAQRSEAGSPAERVATRVLLARIEAARGTPPPPGGALIPLAWEAERSGSLRLAAEVWLDAAGEFAAAGRHDDARIAVDRARRMLVQIPGAEPALSGLLDEAEGRRRFTAGDAAGSLAPLRRAVAVLEARGVAFYAVRALRTLASAKLALGDSRGALRAFAKVARVCDDGDLVLGEVLDHATLHARAVVDGDPTTRRYAMGALATADLAAIRSRLGRCGDPALAERFAAKASSAGRDAVGGREGAVASDLARLRNGASGAVVLDRRDGMLVVPGRPPVSLARRRTLMPMLAAIAAAPEHGVSVAELARRVWQRGPSSSTRTAVKVAVSRLRQLLGAHALSLVAVRVDGAPGYKWDAQRLALVLVPVDAADATHP